MSVTRVYLPAPYYKLNKGFFLGFLFKRLGGLRPPRGLNKKASEKHPLSITCPLMKFNKNVINAVISYWLSYMYLVSCIGSRPNKADLGPVTKQIRNLLINYIIVKTAGNVPI